MKIDKNLLVKTVHSADREVSIPCQEIKIDTVDQEIAVWWKQGRHRKRTNEVGDGMEVLRIHNRPFIAHALDIDWFLYGLSVWQEFDETQNLTLTYLYKFSKDEEDIKLANEVLKTMLPNATIKQQDRFVVLEGGSMEFYLPSKLLLLLKEKGIPACISYLCGLLFAYGKSNLEEDVIFNCTIYLPLTGPIAQREELIQQIILQLKEYGIYISQNTVNQRDGQLLQLTISDRELLYHIVENFFDGTGQIRISRYETYLQQLEHLHDFLDASKAPIEVISQIEDSVLKTVRK